MRGCSASCIRLGLGCSWAESGLPIGGLGAERAKGEVASPSGLEPHQLGTAVSIQATEGTCGMGQQSIRYRILANGRVEEEVIGVQGAACQALTGAIEASLGTVLSSRPTAEAYGQDAVTSLHQQASLQQQST